MLQPGGFLGLALVLRFPLFLDVRHAFLLFKILLVPLDTFRPGPSLEGLPIRPAIRLYAYRDLVNAALVLKLIKRTLTIW